MNAHIPTPPLVLLGPEPLSPAPTVPSDPPLKPPSAIAGHEAAGGRPVLVLPYDTVVVDGRNLARPVNRALARVVPPEGCLAAAA